MGDVVAIRAPVTVAEIRAAEWQLTLHMRLAKGGVYFQYRCIEHSRLLLAKSRANGRSPMRQVFSVDGREVDKLEHAVALLNGEEPPAPAAPMAKISLRQQIDELDRELEQRERVYPRLVSSGGMRQSIADFQVARLKAARDTLAWLAEHELVIKQRLAP